MKSGLNPLSEEFNLFNKGPHIGFQWHCFAGSLVKHHAAQLSAAKRPPSEWPGNQRMALLAPPSGQGRTPDPTFAIRSFHGKTPRPTWERNENTLLTKIRFLVKKKLASQPVEYQMNQSKKRFAYYTKSL